MVDDKEKKNLRTSTPSEGKCKLSAQGLFLIT